MLYFYTYGIQLTTMDTNAAILSRVLAIYSGIICSSKFWTLIYLKGSSKLRKVHYKLLVWCSFQNRQMLQLHSAMIWADNIC